VRSARIEDIEDMKDMEGPGSGIVWTWIEAGSKGREIRGYRE